MFMSMHYSAANAYIMLKGFLKGTYDLPSTALHELKNVCLCIYCGDKQAPSSYSWPRHGLRTGGARWLPTASQGWVKCGEQNSLLCTKIVCDDKQSSSSVTVRTNHMTYILLFVKATDGCLHFAFQSDPHFSDFSGIVHLTKLQL